MVSARIVRVCFASVLIAAGLLIMVSFFLSAASSVPVEGSGFVGFFLFASFGYAGVWVPVYLIWTGVLLLLPVFPLWRFIGINLFFVPVFFTALALRSFSDPFADRSVLVSALINSFTRPGAAVISLLFAFVSFLLVLRFLPVLKKRFPSVEALFSDAGGSASADSPAADAEPAYDVAGDVNDTASLDTDDSRIMSPDSVIARIAKRGVSVGMVEWEHVDEDDEGLYAAGDGEDKGTVDVSDFESEDASYADDKEAARAVSDDAESFVRLEDMREKSQAYAVQDAESGYPLRLEGHGHVVQDVAGSNLQADETDADDFEPSYDGGAEGLQGLPSQSDDSAVVRDVSYESANADEDCEDKDEAAEDSVTDSVRSSSGYRVGAAAGATLSAYIENYRLPVDGILKNYPEMSGDRKEEIRQAGEILLSTLAEFGIDAELIGIRRGPVITMYEILPAPGVKLSKIVNLSDNIALRLAAESVRIVAPIPGKRAVGVEIPNRERELVSMRSLMQEGALDDSGSIPVVLGRDITGEPQVVDLAQTPHLLIAGATGSGKSVCVNSMICSILYTRAPQDVRLMLIDPKIVELKLYNDIPHLLTPVVTDPKKAFQALQYCVYEMERRYALLDAVGARDIRTYNNKIKKERLAMERLPYIVIIIDEFADLMATSGKELESILARLAAMSRAVGLHLVLATQRPSIDVITGLIKANIPSRIAFMVASKFDSRIIMDAVGAEKLLGKGDMLFTSPWQPFPLRIQGAFVSEEEVENLVDYLRDLSPPDYIDDIIFTEDEEDDFPVDELEDPLMEKAIEIVISTGKASASYLQRRLKVGYNRAARMVEAMESLGIVGPANGSKPREIVNVPDEYQKYLSGNASS